MATDVISAPLQPKKRARLGWDVGPSFLDDTCRLQLLLASQIIAVQNNWCLERGEGVPSPPNKHSASPAFRDDDKDGHMQFEIGDVLNGRYKVLSKMGEGTFGRVLECLDMKSQEIVAVKVIRSVSKYREAAMIEVDVLQRLQRSRNGFRRRSKRYFKHGQHLYWPEGASSRDSIRAVRRLPHLKNVVMDHADHSVGLLIDLLEQLLKYDPRERLTAREALRHPFFRTSRKCDFTGRR